MKVHAGLIVCEMARRFNWQANRMMVEFAIDGGIADLAFVTKSGYLTEIEVKVTIADLRADALKDKWKRPRPHVARLYFAVPDEIAERALPLIPETAGLIGVSLGTASSQRSLYSREIRAAKRMKARPVTDAHMRAIHDAAYYRYWRWRAHTMPQIAADNERWRQLAMKAAA